MADQEVSSTKVLSARQIMLSNLKTTAVDFTNMQTEEDYDIFNHTLLNRVVANMQIGDMNPCWGPADDADLVRRKNVALSYIQAVNPVNGQINDRIAKRFPVADLNIPRDSVAVLQTAIRYLYENPFVAKAARIKADFAAEGFKHRTHNQKVKEYYDQWVDALKLRTVTRKIFHSMLSIGIVPIWWGGEEKRAIEFVELLDPRMCHIDYNFGVPNLYLKIDESMRSAVEDPEGKINIRNKWRFKAMPKYWVDQIKTGAEGKGPVPLSGTGTELGFIRLKEGSFTVVDVRAASISRTVSALDGLPMEPAFDALQRYRLLSAGDFAVAWQLKNMVVLISEGDPKAEGERWVPVTAQRLANLQAQFQRPDSSYTVYCDPTTQVRFVVPPIKDVFTEEKYKQVEKEIKEVLDIPSFMWISEDKSDYGNATNEMKVFRQQMKTARALVKEQFFVPLYKRLRECTTRPGFKITDICYPTFSISNLQDDSFFQKHMTDMYAAGLLSAETIIEESGFDFEYEAEQKTIEKDKYKLDEDTVFQPLFNPNPGKGGPEQNGPGKPTGPNPKQAPGNDKSPRKSGQK